MHNYQFKRENYQSTIFSNNMKDANIMINIKFLGDVKHGKEKKYNNSDSSKDD
jgi:hypothetical protein